MNAIRFSYQFDAQRIWQELQAIEQSFDTIHSIRIKENKLQGMHLITPNRDGEKDGNGFSYRLTAELKQSPYLQSILDTFQCDKFIFRVHNLKAKGEIKLHRDLGRGLQDRIVRIHIPVTSNEEVYFYVNGERVQMQNGECWFADITQFHEVENRSDTDRLQLMMDCELNEWWENILKEHGVQLEEISEWSHYSVEELKSMKESFQAAGSSFNDALKKIDVAIADKVGK